MALNGDEAWEAAFLDGLGQALAAFGMALIGGDTIALRAGAPRVLTLTAIGRPGDATPARSGGIAGDILWLAGTLGDSAAGLARLRADPRATGPLVEAYRQPKPLIAQGRTLAPQVHAMMDVSDGLLLDCARLARASALAAEVDLAAIPLSQAFIAERGDTIEARLFAATGGDDYALLAAAPEGLLGLCLPDGTRLSAIGRLVDGEGLSLRFDDEPVPVPEQLGYEHRPL